VLRVICPEENARVQWRKNVSKYLMWMTVVLASLTASVQARAQETLALENARLKLSFAPLTGTLETIHNKLTGEAYQVSGDRFAVEAAEFRLDFADAKLSSIAQQGETVKVRYQGREMVVDVTYTLASDRAFAEKHLVLTCGRPYGLKAIVPKFGCVVSQGQD